VAFYNGATEIGSGTLNNSGTVEYAGNALPAGTNSITAVYSGDYTHSPSTSSVLLESVTPLPITLMGTNLVLQYTNSIIGTNYVLVSSPSLQPPITWTPVLTNAGTGGILTFTIPFTTGATNSFFTYQLQ
jgi:hypothetical protein